MTVLSLDAAAELKVSLEASLQHARRLLCEVAGVLDVYQQALTLSTRCRLRLRRWCRCPRRLPASKSTDPPAG